MATATKREEHLQYSAELLAESDMCELHGACSRNVICMRCRHCVQHCSCRMYEELKRYEAEGIASKGQLRLRPDNGGQHAA